MTPSKRHYGPTNRQRLRDMAAEIMRLSAKVEEVERLRAVAQAAQEFADRHFDSVFGRCDGLPVDHARNRLFEALLALDPEAMEAHEQSMAKAIKAARRDRCAHDMVDVSTHADAGANRLKYICAKCDERFTAGVDVAMEKK